MDERLNSGSCWHRWEPHVHAPGTILNDQFKGDDRWDRYLLAIETSVPPIRALGIADYYSVETYEQACASKQQGRLQPCELLFPNVEMRLAIGTIKGKWVNIHLLVSPEDPNHVVELKRFLARLTFSAYNETFSCSRDDLTRLGQRVNPDTTEPTAALQVGSEQFKVSFDQLKAIYKDSAWAQRNILIAVAGGETDGISGVRDSADATLRQEVEKFAHVIFASSAAQREFWVGKRSLTPDELRRRYGGLKPCMHGSDAHAHESVGIPAEDRYSWLKGNVAFDTLRQACIEPIGRAHVGNEAPTTATPSQVIATLAVSGAPWLQTPNLALNPGLVAIIGARGSGKTALADMIALACDATSPHLNRASFLVRAEDLLVNASVSVTWQTADSARRALDRSDDGAIDRYARARYLSQQFVEELCSADGATDELLTEIERVIFEAHPALDRHGATDFKELLEFRASRHRAARTREEESLVELSERIGTELEKDKLLEPLRKQIQEKERLIAAYSRDRLKLVSKGSEARMERVALLSAAAEKVRGFLRYFKTQEQTLVTLNDEVVNFRAYQAPEALRRSQEEHKASGLGPTDWEAFLLDYSGDVDSVLARQLASARKNAKDWTGVPPASQADPQVALVGHDAALDQQPLAVLEAEISRLQKLVNIDRDIANKFVALSKRITEESPVLAALKEKLTDCDGARLRARGLVEEREAAYARVFDAVVAEVDVLSELYKPLMARLRHSQGTLNKLSFSVRREANVVGWAKEGEDLLDLRQKGPFKGRGTLIQLAESTLKTPWEHGDPQIVTAAMRTFRSDNEKELLEHAPVPKADQADYRSWLKRFAKWLYSTEHIGILYSIDYDGVDIRKLSPGTRGIVLLLLYLALDEADDRPLIIDQPEESLDPKSVFDELVGLFVEAKQKRQVIIVTHNANLVVNTDADQIIVARAGPHPFGELPPISYLSGGLETEEIRRAVCDILEGSEDAFRERARRLRVHLER